MSWNNPFNTPFGEPRDGGTGDGTPSNNPAGQQAPSQNPRAVAPAPNPFAFVPPPLPGQQGQQGQTLPRPPGFVPPPLTVTGPDPFSFVQPTPSAPPNENPAVQNIAAQQDQGPPQMPLMGWMPLNNVTHNANGLPAYFSACDTYHPAFNPGHRDRVLFYYVNDGPQLTGEQDRGYRTRILRASERMGIEHRHGPAGPSNLNYPGGSQNTEWKTAQKVFASMQGGRKRDHVRRLDQGSTSYDANYEAIWDADKQARAARNALRRQNAVEEVRQDLINKGYDRLLTPPPPDDSGDDLYDWGTNGPISVTFRRSNVQARPGRRAGRPPVLPENAARTPQNMNNAREKAKEDLRKRTHARKTGLDGKKPLYPSLKQCQRCKKSVWGKKKCNLRDGRPCSNCVEAQAECLPLALLSKQPGYAKAYPHGHSAVLPAGWEQDDDTRCGSRSRSRSRSPTRSQSSNAGYRSRSPLRDQDRPFRPCANCHFGNIPFKCTPDRPCQPCREERQKGNPKYYCMEYDVVDGRALPRWPTNVPGAEASGYDDVGFGLGFDVGNSQRPPAFEDAGIRPPDPAASSLDGLIDPALLEPSQTMHQNAPPASGPSSFGMGGNAPTSQFQTVPNTHVGDQSDNFRDLNPFDKIREVQQDCGLQSTATASQELQNTNPSWATGEAPAQADPSITSDPPAQSGTGFVFDINDFMANLDNLRSEDEDTLMAGTDALPEVPGFQEGYNPALPQPEDHDTMEYQMSPDTQQPVAQLPLPQQQQPQQQQQQQPQPAPQQQTGVPNSTLPEADVPIVGPVLPLIPQQGGIGMFGYWLGCQEIKDLNLAEDFATEARLWGQYPECLKEPTRYCEHIEHGKFRFCQDCFEKAKRHFMIEESMAISETKIDWCMDCADTIKQSLMNGEPVDVDRGNCRCVTQLRTTWICIGHKQQAIDTVKARTVASKAFLSTVRGGQPNPCPKCFQRLPNPSSNVWSCVCCRRPVVGNENNYRY